MSCSQPCTLQSAGLAQRLRLLPTSCRCKSTTVASATASPTAAAAAAAAACVQSTPCDTSRSGVVRGEFCSGEALRVNVAAAVSWSVVEGLLSAVDVDGHACSSTALACIVVSSSEVEEVASPSRHDAAGVAGATWAASERAKEVAGAARSWCSFCRSNSLDAAAHHARKSGCWHCVDDCGAALALSSHIVALERHVGPVCCTAVHTDQLSAHREALRVLVVPCSAGGARSGALGPSKDLFPPNHREQTHTHRSWATVEFRITYGSTDPLGSARPADWRS